MHMVWASWERIDYSFCRVRSPVKIEIDSRPERVASRQGVHCFGHDVVTGSAEVDVIGVEPFLVLRRDAKGCRHCSPTEIIGS